VKEIAVIALDPPETVADLHERLGFVPLHRIRMDPAPGTATDKDVVRHLDGGNKRLYELVDGTLVEKAVGTRESILAVAIIIRLGQFVKEHKLGLVSGADGPFRMLLGNVRYPDVSFVPRSAFPGGKIPKDAIWSVVPALAIEVLSESNTPKEIDRKLGELFNLGCQCCWVIDPDDQTARVFTEPKVYTELKSDGILLGDPMLPGFRLPLSEIFGTFDLFE